MTRAAVASIAVSIALAVALIIVRMQRENALDDAIKLGAKASKFDQMCSITKAAAKLALKDERPVKAIASMWLEHHSEITLCLPATASEYAFGRAIIEGPDDRILREFGALVDSLEGVH